MTEPTVPQLFDLSGKVALITGATGWLGAALSRALAEAGAGVVVSSRSREKAERFARELPVKGSARHYGIEMNYLDPASIEKGVADVVYGTCFLGGPHRVLFFWHSVGNKFLTLLSNMFTNLNLSDMETCYKAFRREVIQSVELEEKRFGFEPEVTAKIARMDIRIYEVPISYYGRTYAEGKKISWKDGFSALRCILKYNLFKAKKR